MAMNESLESLGFDPSISAAAESSIPDDCVPTRVTQVQKESYFVTDGKGEVYAETTGRLLYGAASSLDLPVTGDWVMTQIVDGSMAIIHSVLPRKTLLKRKTPGRKSEYQPIAANIDIALLMQALDEDFSLRRLERYLIMARQEKIEPVILMSKKDLVSDEELKDYLAASVGVAGGATVIAFSSETGDGIGDVMNVLKPKKTYCLLGSSGVGKSTLLNLLVGEDVMETKAIRESDSKGRHTTTSRQLKILANGVMLIDTPGMRELGNIEAAEGIAETFSEIEVLASSCRFKDCSHQHEDGCTVLVAVENGELENERYQSYLRMVRESEYNESSYLELREKHKKLGKLYKTVQRHNRKR